MLFKTAVSSVAQLRSYLPSPWLPNQRPLLYSRRKKQRLQLVLAMLASLVSHPTSMGSNKANVVTELPEASFVTCQSCEDYDLCIPCHRSAKHGHHPKHAFLPAVANTTLDAVSKAMLGPGRNTGHNAICDGCDKVLFLQFLFLTITNHISTSMVFATSALIAQIGTTARPALAMLASSILVIDLYQYMNL